jgi:hypothetical protein
VKDIHLIDQLFEAITGVYATLLGVGFGLVGIGGEYALYLDVRTVFFSI